MTWAYSSLASVLVAVILNRRAGLTWKVFMRPRWRTSHRRIDGSKGAGPSCEITTAPAEHRRVHVRVAQIQGPSSGIVVQFSIAPRCLFLADLSAGPRVGGNWSSGLKIFKLAKLFLSRPVSDCVRDRRLKWSIDSWWCRNAMMAVRNSFQRGSCSRHENSSSQIRL